MSLTKSDKAEIKKMIREALMEPQDTAVELPTWEPKVLKKSKMKAWKRLKDCGIRFTDWSCDFKNNEFIEVDVYRPNSANAYMDNGQLRKDLDLLFGGEE